MADGDGPPLFDPATLEADELELWESLCGDAEPRPMTVTDLHAFGTICSLELAGVPAAVLARLAELDPARHLREYREAFGRRRREPGSD